MRRACCVGLLVALAASSFSCAPPADQEGLSVEQVAGIWKVCYEPGLPGVSEPAGGYLALMPDSRFYEVTEGCGSGGHEPPIVGKVGAYSIERDSVILHIADESGKPFDRRLRFVGAANVVVFDRLKDEPVRLAVLREGPNLNYGYGKAFWNKGWRR